MRAGYSEKILLRLDMTNEGYVDEADFDAL
jgi:hypothetical protein